MKNVVKLINGFNTIIGQEVRRRRLGGSELITIDVHGTTTTMELDLSDWKLEELQPDHDIDLQAMLPIQNQVLRWGDLSHTSEDIEPARRERVVTDIEHANIVCSDLDGQEWDDSEPQHGYGPSHKILFDIDFPVHVVQSSEGHGHLYIDRKMSWSTVVMLMAAFVEAGLMEPGYMYAAIQRGYTSLRVPWALKGSGNYIEEPDDEFKRQEW
ncbi:hypothetical protein SEA_WESAK_17 [Microbacterium phage Wesak]|uniref:Uncharacterized protein n=1 Tax=Microbacterium phage Wesak TaxID=2653751 RepID=A0A5Q2WL97_9CAUD|nr:hypothetical protein SEA_WESAK_17 [Microbacterium phage Wesak]